MKQFKLHNTDGKTFFDFRSNPESRCEGFTVSYLDDGTVVMSGDYGCLCWKRNYHHEKGDFQRDYGFPNDTTNIGYFEEKVQQFGIKQVVKEWDYEQAKAEIEVEILKRYNIDNNDYECFADWKYYSLKEIRNKCIDEGMDEEDITKERVKYLLKEMRFDTKDGMYDDLQQFDSEMGSDYSCECNYGEGYVHQFEFMFKCLQSVSQQILDVVNNPQEITSRTECVGGASDESTILSEKFNPTSVDAQSEQGSLHLEKRPSTKPAPVSDEGCGKRNTLRICGRGGFVCSSCQKQKGEVL